MTRRQNIFLFNMERNCMLKIANKALLLLLYLYAYLHTYIIHRYIHRDIYTFIHTYIPTYLHTRAHTHAHARTHARTHARALTQTHTRTHARSHARTHTRTHARTHTSPYLGSVLYRYEAATCPLHSPGPGSLSVTNAVDSCKTENSTPSKRTRGAVGVKVSDTEGGP